MRGSVLCLPFSHVAVQLSQHHVLKCLGAFVKNQLAINAKGYLGTFCSVPLSLCCPLCPVCCDCIVTVESGTVRAPAVLFSYQTVWAAVGPLYYNNSHFRISLRISPTKPALILIRVSLNLFIYEGGGPRKTWNLFIENYVFILTCLSFSHFKVLSI